MKYRIAQIIPYFGKWPEWIELYFYSCGRNPMIDFIFYTDCPLPNHRYNNTIFHKCTFDDYVSMVSKRLELREKIQRPYKLTDLKPFMGYVHKSDFEGYDFWSFGDLDLIYGDMSMIVNDTMLEKYDIITTHSNRIAGHCAIIRNNEYYSDLCFRIKGWQEGLVANVHCCYDECAWTGLVNPLRHNTDRLYRYVLSHLGCDRDKLYDIVNRTFLKRKFIQELYTTPVPQPKDGEKEYPQWKYELESNRIIDPDGRNLPYLHLMAFKKCQYIDTELYWKEGYWKLEDDFTKYKTIFFDYKEVKGE